MVHKQFVLLDKMLTSIKSLIVFWIHRKSYARMSQIMEEELGGEETFLTNFYELYRAELAKGSLNSSMICAVFAK